MTPAEAIAALDDALEAAGDQITLRRLVGTANQVPFSATLPAHPRGYRASEMVSGVQQGDTRVIISPTHIEASGWPGASPARLGDEGLDRRVPRKGDEVWIQGRKRAVESCDPIYMAGVLVRLILQVRG